jgi:hypothetical protein
MLRCADANPNRALLKPLTRSFRSICVFVLSSCPSEECRRVVLAFCNSGRFCTSIPARRHYLAILFGAIFLTLDDVRDLQRGTRCGSLRLLPVTDN